MMEVKTFDVTLGGEVVKVPCEPKLGLVLDIFDAMDKADSLAGNRAGYMRALLLLVSAGTQKPEAILKANLTIEELTVAADTLRKGWIASGFFKEPPPEKAVGEGSGTATGN